MSKISGILNIVESLCYYTYVINITSSGCKICHEIAPELRTKPLKAQNIWIMHNQNNPEMGQSN